MPLGQESERDRQESVREKTGKSNEGGNCGSANRERERGNSRKGGEEKETRRAGREEMLEGGKLAENTSAANEPGACAV